MNHSPLDSGKAPDPADREVTAFRMVELSPPAARPPAQIPFWKALVGALMVVGALSLVGHHWIIPALEVDRPAKLLPVTVHHQDLDEPEVEEKSDPIRRVAPVHVATPRVVPKPTRHVPVALVQPQVDLTVAPFDSDEVLEEAAQPFPSAPVEAPPKPKVNQPTRTKPIAKTTTPPKRPKGPTRAARELRKVKPIYPRSARRAGVEGKVMLSVEVGSNGRVRKVKISRTSGSRALDSAAMTAVKAWVFDPALSNGRAVLSKVTVPIVFGLE